MDDPAVRLHATACPPSDCETTGTDEEDSLTPLPLEQQAGFPADGTGAHGAPGGNGVSRPAQAGVPPTGAFSVEQVIEALLFSSDAPLSATRLAELIGGCTPFHVRKYIEVLNARYARAGLTFRIVCIARGYQMMTLPGFEPWVEKLVQQRSQTRLSPAALETLSIIAYKQPIIRAEVEAIRGVACGEVIARLRELGLVRIVGRAEIVGRPLLYGTTRKFLDVFGLADLDDLPPLESLRLKPAATTADSDRPLRPPPLPQPEAELTAVGA